jgi:hypothetical protein
VLERTNDELLDPLVDRAYTLMDRAGLIPTPPEELSGVALKVEYISIMAQAQKLVGVVGLDRFLQTTVPLFEVYPEIRHKIEIFQVVDNYGEMLGIDPRVVRSTEDALKRQQADNQAQQEMQQTAQAVEMAKAAKLASEAPVTGDSVLSRVVQGAQQQIPGAAA